MENEHVYSVFGNHNGMFFFTNNTERQEDFWVFLGPLVGCGILTLSGNFYIIPFKWTNSGECEKFVEELEALIDKYGLIRAPYPDTDPA